MVFSGVYPVDGSDFEALNHAIERLTCNDASVSVTKESSTALGLGFRCAPCGLVYINMTLLTSSNLIVQVVSFLQVWFLRLASHGCLSPAS